MATSPVKAPKIIGITNPPKDVIGVIKKRRSQELIIGLCGAIGSGIKPLKNTICEKLKSYGYEVHHIRLSDIIISKTDPTLKSLTGYDRYVQLQDAGDELRRKHNSSILAACAINEIALTRIEEYGSDEEESDELVKTDKKVAYILDQLKHPDEVSLLRTVYNHNFYLIGLIRTEKERKLNLEEEKINPGEIEELIMRDRKDSDEHGQQVEKTLYGADFFIRNIHNQSQLLQASVERFIKLVHGVNGITPTHDEIGMFAAYSASLRSACLSRQVGAAITDASGNVIATGCNDVPAAGGGLYSASTSKDFRCVHKGQCSNDKHKSLLKEEIRQTLTKEIHDERLVQHLVQQIVSETKIKSLIEYSRAIHAEMDAIVSLARETSESTKNKILFATTYPCHNCARHIVAAGINKVVYIEPYEKSLAMKLHDDAISDIDEVGKVIFMPFEGVSPNRFEKFFKSNGARKDNSGRVIHNHVNDLYHVDTQYLDSYHAYEAKVAAMLAGMFENTDA
ncbi:deaminase [Aeromonas allosaccharophila]|uniref:anti-phage dCTP deaminase n=2 Tax=Aeromonas TaxID=642 RepID=UPI001F252DD3|nr:anti-phage dCTP deaminase [Aeromonas allosaccharophila]MCE9850233.1 deaminase [Aeromonas allosaccharophila]